MAHNKDQQQQPHKKAPNQSQQGQTNAGQGKKGTPMIVERVSKIPVVNFAISTGFSQYGKLKSSNITVGDIMARAEAWASYFWQKVQPIVEKLQDPINRADQLACTTFDFVEDRLNSMKLSQSIGSIVTKCTGTGTNQNQEQQQQQQQVASS